VDVSARLDYVHLKGTQDHYALRKTWAWFLIFALSAVIALQHVILFCVGWSWLDFTAYPWVLQILLVQNLAQIVGLATFAVRYLFKDIPK